MKAVCIVGMPNGVYAKAARVINSVGGALEELGMPVSRISLLECGLPYYEEGAANDKFASLAKSLAETKNVIFAYNVTNNSPGAVMKVFLEYLGGSFSGILENKCILNISISESQGERAAAEYVAGLLGERGAHELARICIGGGVLNALNSGTFPIGAIEKYAEDYYRLTKQNRLFIPSGVFFESRAQKTGVPAPKDDAMFAKFPEEELKNLKSQVETSMKKTLKNPVGFGTFERAQDIMEEKQTNSFGNEFFMEYLTDMKDEPETIPQKDFDVFDAKQAEDIEELTRLFATKLKDESVQEAADNLPGRPYAPPNNFTPAKRGTPPHKNVANERREPVFSDALQMAGDLGGQIVPRNKTCRQMTGSLPHYFQTQLAQDTEAVFQFNIFGEEEFSGYLVIKNHDNEYYDGQYDSPDVTIISSAQVWQNILRGKLTAQKAFMTGMLKVRGNFMLLNRFDQIYKKMS